MLECFILRPFAFKTLSLTAMIGAAAMLGIASCSPRHLQRDQINQGVGDSLKPIADVLADHTAEWMSIPGVIGTGETEKDNKPAIMIFVDSLTDTLASRLPPSAEGYPVVIEQIGRVVPLPLPKQ